MAVPMKNLLPNKSGVMKVPYLAMPISYGLNSTQSVGADVVIHRNETIITAVIKNMIIA